MKRSIGKLAFFGSCLVMLCVTAGGCLLRKPTLWANTATSKGDGFSTDRLQWAYDGESVTFDFWPSSDGTDYVVFECEDKSEIIQASEAGEFRLNATFKAGVEPKEYVMWATGYMRRGRSDWVFDKSVNEWYLHRGLRDKPDKMTGESRMTIRCYRIRIRMPFRAPQGPPKTLVLTLVKQDGTRINIPRRASLTDEERGFLILGPDSAGNYEIIYTPTFDEVNRTGHIVIEGLIEHKDGRIERLEQRQPTP